MTLIAKITKRPGDRREEAAMHLCRGSIPCLQTGA